MKHILKTNKQTKREPEFFTHFRPIVRNFRAKTTTNRDWSFCPPLSLSISRSLPYTVSQLLPVYLNQLQLCLPLSVSSCMYVYICKGLCVCVLGFLPEPASVGFVLWGHDGLVLVDLLAAAAVAAAAAATTRRRRRCRLHSLLLLLLSRLENCCCQTTSASPLWALGVELLGWMHARTLFKCRVRRPSLIFLPSKRRYSHTLRNPV